MIKQDSDTNLSEEENAQHKFECELDREPEPSVIVVKASDVKVLLPNETKEDYPGTVRVYARAIEPTEPFVVRAPIVKASVSNNDEAIVSPTHTQNEQSNSCITQVSDYVKCGSQRVADGIGGHFKIKSDGGTWGPKRSAFISAQTGQGKNHFIENTLLPYVRELNHRIKAKHKVLIISNRIALKWQIKNRIKGNDDLIGEEGKIYRYSEYADVMTYQGLLNNAGHLEKMQKNEISSYLYVICDEAHFFTSDAMFNPDTAKILSAIVDIFKKAIRVYMTATPHECLEYVLGYERKTVVLYEFERDYNYLSVMCYSEIDELFGRIVKSVNDNKEKWLIFIDDKEKCKKVKEKLEEYWEKVEETNKEEKKNKKSMTVTSEDKNEISMKEKKEKIFAVDTSSKKDEAYREMVLNEKLNGHTYVLISTSVLDNGVNLNGIHNIVISDMSIVKSLQMVGRARVKDANDKKTLYIKRFDEKYVESRINDFEEQNDAYHKYDLANGILDYGTGVRLPEVDTRSEYDFLMKYYNGRANDWENAKHWFWRDKKKPNELYPNAIARSLAEKSVPIYKSTLEEMRRTDDGQKYTGQKYLEFQMSWFGKTYDEENDITVTDDTKTKEEFTGFLESYAGKKLFTKNDNGEDEQDKFRKEFTRLSDKVFGRQDKNKDRVSYGLDITNTTLVKYNVPYKVKSDRSTTGNKKTFWEVVRSEQEETGV
ncbi:MAG: DEAD/DEAH box helicase family protein [Prevotella sp.]|jgi:hypothetical protein|nr:DEAD/DEAH box helicase family protein [Prevotella sp.]